MVFKVHKGNCVMGWVEDKSVKGVTNLQPVTCSTVITGLSRIIARLSLGEELNEAEAALVTELVSTYAAS